MTTYDSAVGALPNIGVGPATDDQINGSPVERARKRPVLVTVVVLGLAAVAAGSVLGGRKVVEARRPRSRWQQILDKVR